MATYISVQRLICASDSRSTEQAEYAQLRIGCQ